MVPPMHSSRPPSVEPASGVRLSSVTESEAASSMRLDVRVAAPTTLSSASLFSTLSEQVVPAAVRGADAVSVRHANWPCDVELDWTSHVASAELLPSAMMVTCIRLAWSSKPSPVRTSSTPPAALPVAVAVVVLGAEARRTAVRETTPRTTSGTDGSVA